MKKIYDLAVKIGTYKKDGKDKNRYLNVGCILVNDEGQLTMLLNKTFNPAGVPSDPDRDSIFVSMFKKDSSVGKEVDSAPPVADMENPFSDEDVPF